VNDLPSTAFAALGLLFCVHACRPLGPADRRADHERCRCNQLGCSMTVTAAEPKTRLPSTATAYSRPDQLLAMIALELLRLLSRAAGRTTPTGRLGLLPRRAAERFVAAALETTWRGSPIGGGHCGTTTSPRSIA
jgi:hypothetical protein